MTKVDLLAVPETQALRLIRRLVDQGHDVLAEKIETPAAFQRSMSAGASLAQGSLLAPPRGLQGFRPTGMPANHIDLLRAIERWVTLLAMSSMVSGAPSDLLRIAALRARTCEEIQHQRGQDGQLTAVSLGMFSILGDDGLPPTDPIAQLPVTDEVAAALRGEPGEYLDILTIPLATEAGA